MNKRGLNLTETECAVRDRLLGTWKLVSTEETLKDGGTRPFPHVGANGKGFLIYQADGYMCALLVNPDQPKFDPVQSGAREKAASNDWSFAYCGRYEIDVGKKQIIHLPEVATHPGYVGTRQVRPYEFNGERLILGDLENGHSEVVRWKIVGKKCSETLYFERMAAPRRRPAGRPLLIRVTLRAHSPAWESL